jgi:translation initiation factor 2 subunit 1
MELKKIEWPEEGDLVIATAKTITDYGAYVVLDEYHKEGLLHVSEVSSGWVRNIRNFVREGQKFVLKVLRVNTEKGHIDLSLRRVTRRERKEKILLWKKERKADSLLRSASEELKISPQEIYDKVGALLEKEFGGIYEGLEKTTREGAEVLLKIGIPENIAIVIEKIVKEKIKVPMVKVKGILSLQCPKPNGVNLIRDSLLNARKIESKGAEIHVYVIAPPKYRIVVSAVDYKEAEEILDKATEVVIKSIDEVGGQGTFKREK